MDAKHAARHHDFQCLLHINNILNGTKHRLSASSSIFPRLPAKLRPPPAINPLSGVRLAFSKLPPAEVYLLAEPETVLENDRAANL